MVGRPRPWGRSCTPGFDLSAIGASFVIGRDAFPVRLLSAMNLVALLIVTTALFFAREAVAAPPGFPEMEPAPYMVTNAPADGAVSRLDPPAFVWVPAGQIGRSTLQYSRDPTFPPAATTTVECARTIHVPRQVLGAGTWYWRFGVKPSGTDRISYSRVRRFSIAADAEPVPFPDVPQVIARLEGVRPRNYVRAGEVDRFRSLAAGPLRAYVEELKRECRPYLGEPLLPEPAFPNVPSQRMIHRPFNAGMFACASVYVVTGDEAYGREARRRLRHVAGWNPNGSTSLTNNDEAGAELVRVMSRTYDWIHPLLSDADRRTIRTVLAQRIPQVYRALVAKPFELRPYESHAMDYYVGDLLESTLAMAGELPVAEMLEYVLLQLWSPFFPPYGGEDGGWSEGPGYWQWSTATFLRNFTLVRQNCGVDLTRKPWLQHTAYFKLYANPPYAKMSPFGDTQEDGVQVPARPRISLYSNTTDVMYKLGVVTDNPYALWYADQLGSRPFGVERFMYYKPGDDRGRPPRDLPQARCFDDVGLAALHSDLADAANNVYLLLRSSPFGSISHAYADKNAFALFAYGEPMAIASGYYDGYRSPHHAGWTWTTRAANSILVDGEGQPTRDWTARGRIANFATGDFAHYAVSDATDAYKGRLNRFRRHVMFLRPTLPADDPVIVMLDDLEGAQASTYDWMLHALEKMQVETGTNTVNIRRGAARTRVQFLAPRTLQYTQTNQFTVAPKGDDRPNQWHLTARTPSAEKAVRFVTVFLPHRAGRQASMPEARLIEAPAGWTVVELTRAPARQLVAFRTGAIADSPLQLAGFQCNGEAAAVAYDEDGRVRASMSVDPRSPVATGGR